MASSLVSVAWLKQNLNNPSLVVLDASMQNKGQLFIPGARLFDFDKKICDQNNPLPHMMPTADFFEQEVRALGINQDSLIVVYDQKGIYSSPRAWWMFRAMGHENVFVLDGGLPLWLKFGFPTESGPQISQQGDFKAKPSNDYFCGADEIALALKDNKSVVLDARSQGRFAGLEPEPRAGLRGGHMPLALNLPFANVQNGTQMKSVGELQEIFKALVKSDERIFTSCGSGVTACIVALAAELAGYKKITVYDGSWSEWGLPGERPVTC